MLGELSWEDELDSRLDLLGGEGVLLVVSDELGGLGGDLLEDIVDEGVHDGHGFLGDSSLWVNLLENSVDVDGEGLGSLLGSLDDLLFLSLGGFTLSWHCNIYFIFIEIPQPLNNDFKILRSNLVIITNFNWSN